jgi:hypothetical protein
LHNAQKRDSLAALTPTALQALWFDLGSDDGPKSYAAINSLVDHPNESIPLLRTELKRISPPSEQKMAHLIAELSSDEEKSSEKAFSDLDELGEVALPALRQAVDHPPSRKVRHSIEELIQYNMIEVLAPSPARRREMRGIEVLELTRTDEAKRVIEDLARGDPAARRTQLAKEALARISSGPR